MRIAADGGAFVGLLDVAVQGFEVEFHLAQVFGPELVNLEVEGHEALETAVIEQEVEPEVLAANLQEILLADKGEIPSQFKEEFPEVGQKAGLEAGFGVDFRQVEEIEEIGVLEDGLGAGLNLCQQH